ncbi:MAG TPA: GNAT family N-acetyltransferase [Allosphingosinicella sp.]|jgi:RimJ/RimL family protein N-acetyltransferase
MFARTERLLLRPGWMQDAPALFRAIADEGIVRNLASVPWPYSREHAEAFLAAERGPGEPKFLIFLRTAAAPQLVGAIGIACRRGDQPELGYWIARRFWGRGFATEAGEAVIQLARDSLRLPRLGASHFADNPASGRVLEKLGFRPSGVVIPRYSAGRREAAPCRLFELELAEPEVRAPVRDCLQMMAAA